MSFASLAYVACEKPGPYNMGGGSGGRIAIYSSSYSFAGITSAYGGTGPSTDANGAAGTIYLETGSVSVYKKLIVNNNGSPSNEAQRTSLSDTAPVNSSVTYYFDEVQILGSAQFALKVANSENAIRTNITIDILSGDGSGTIQAVANTFVTILNASSGPSVFASTSVTTSSASTRQSTAIQYVNSNFVLNVASIYVYSQGVFVLPPSVTVAKVNTIRCQGRLLGITSLSLVQSGSVSVYTACTTSASAANANNTFQLFDLYLGGTSSLSLIHDKTVGTSLLLDVASSITLQESSNIVVTGLVRIQTPILNQISPTSSISAVGAGFTVGMTNLFCPQNAGQQGICYMRCFNEL